jgi:predicted nucleic acid-binding protein
MNVFIDTSAFFALLDRDDENHPLAAGAWKKILESAPRLITSNYILVETVALLQSRLGIEAVRSFQTEMVPAIHIEYVNADLHRLGISALLSTGKRRLSFVDCISFEMMRHFGLKHVFTFDAHFREQGFKTIPP